MMGKLNENMLKFSMDHMELSMKSGQRAEFVACNLCGHSRHRLLLVKNGFNIVKCENCSLVFVNPLPSEEEISLYYSSRNEFYLGYYRRKERKKMRGAVREIWRLRRLLEKKEVTILDVGCGGGFLLKAAQDAGMVARGIDLSEESVSYARQRFGVHAEYGNFLSGKFCPRLSFDVITLFEVIEHWRDPKAGLTKCHSLLKKEGYLVISTPDVEGAGQGNRLLEWEHWRPPEHLYYFSHKTLVKLAEKCGFFYIGDYWRVPWRRRIKSVFRKVDQHTRREKGK